MSFSDDEVGDQLGTESLLWNYPTPVAPAEMLDEEKGHFLKELLHVPFALGAMQDILKTLNLRRSEVVPPHQELPKRVLSDDFVI